MKVLATPQVLEYFESLIPILYEKGYFGFEEAARNYVKDLYDDILTTLPLRSCKPAPTYFNKYGKEMKYAIFTKNKRTTWYVFFTKYKDNNEIIYLIRYIANNHTVAQYINNE